MSMHRLRNPMKSNKLKLLLTLIPIDQFVDFAVMHDDPESTEPIATGTSRPIKSATLNRPDSTMATENGSGGLCGIGSRFRRSGRFIE